MKRPTWLDPRISFCKDTPDHTKGPTPVLLDIHRRDSKIWTWGVEIDFIYSDSASSGAWAQIDSIAYCVGGTPVETGSPASRGDWFQFNFKTGRAAFRFAQQTLLFVDAMKSAGIGLIPQPHHDSLSDLYLQSQSDFFSLEHAAQLKAFEGGQG